MVRNIVLFNQINSPISFYQMVGRGTRLSENKLMFRVYDYTDATRLFGEEFLTKLRTLNQSSGRGTGDSPLIVEIEDSDDWVEENDGGCFMRFQVDGEDTRISVEEYKEQIAANLVKIIPTVEEFRVCWVNLTKRQELLKQLVNAGISPREFAAVEQLGDYDLYDVLADIAYGIPVKRN